MSAVCSSVDIGKNLYQAFPYMLTEVVVVDIDVLGSRTKLGQTSELKSAQIVLKRLAIHIRLSADDTKLAILHFRDQIHDGYYISK